MIQIKKLNTEDPNFKDQLNKLIFFEAEDNIQIEKTVAEILSDVKKRGDQAVIEYTKKFDHIDFSCMEEFEISKEELNLALENLPALSREALEEAAKRVFDYHKKQLISSWSFTEDDETLLGQKVTSLDRVGLYVPGGKAAYPSSVLMNAIPAKVAGVQEIIMVVPSPRGDRNQLVLAAAALLKLIVYLQLVALKQ
jgi:histidinol dehydrogenase